MWNENESSTYFVKKSTFKRKMIKMFINKHLNNMNDIRNLLVTYPKPVINCYIRNLLVTVTSGTC